jgi:hypothetical protein
MLMISHRGNLDGKNESRENSPLYIEEALEKGYNVEIDVWHENHTFFLGHDSPQYEIDINFLKDERLWCHAKDIESLEIMVHNGIHCFWHQQDDYTFTSNGHIWAYPGRPLLPSTICVKPEAACYEEGELLNCAGICSDNIQEYREKFK